MCRSLRNQGRATTAWLEHAYLGYNYRISEMTAALGCVQVSRLDEIVDKRRRVAAAYDQALAPLAERGVIHLPPMEERATASWFVYVIRLADSFTREDRDALMQELIGQKIGCNTYFVPIHTQPYVMDALGTKRGDFAITEHISDRTLAIPFFPNMTGQQVSRVTGALESHFESVSA